MLLKAESRRQMAGTTMKRGRILSLGVFVKGDSAAAIVITPRPHGIWMNRVERFEELGTSLG